MLVVLDYKVGNLASIKNMLKKAGHRDVLITDDKQAIKEASKFILPGVGHFDFGMKQLHKSGFLAELSQKVLEDKTPILGICLGAQLLTASSEEGNEKGLGWIDGKTVSFDRSQLDPRQKVPHMGWNEVQVQKNSRLFEGMHPDPRFYFVHSYHMIIDRETDQLTQTEYGYAFTSGFEKDNVLGVQFHPEKSHKFGLKLLDNYLRNY